MIDRQIESNVLTAQIIIDNIKKLVDKVHFIQLYKDNEYLKAYDIENVTLREEFSFEWFIGEKYKSIELSKDSFKVILKNDTVLEFKPANLYYMNKEEVLDLITKKTCEWEITTSRIYLQAEKIEDKVDGSIFVPAHTTILNDTFEENEELVKGIIKSFIEEAYKMGQYTVMNVPVSIDENLICLYGNSLEGRMIYKISCESL
jgi:hypothetical protein